MSSLTAPVARQQQTGALVVELGPQDARRVQQVNAVPHAEPLAAARHARTIRRLGRFSAQNAVDERGFAHIRDADDHHAHGPCRSDPFSFHWAILSASSLAHQRRRTPPYPCRCWLSVSMHRPCPCSRKSAAQTARHAPGRPGRCGSGSSCAACLPAISSISGLRLTPAECVRPRPHKPHPPSSDTPRICRRVFAICPGYH